MMRICLAVVIALIIPIACIVFPSQRPISSAIRTPLLLPKWVVSFLISMFYLPFCKHIVNMYFCMLALIFKKN